MVDKQYCMSSYLALRYIERDDMDFFEGLRHQNMPPVPPEEKTPVGDPGDMDRAIRAIFGSFGSERLGIMLSGGMDSACLASYMPGCDAYTFRFLDGGFQRAELERAEQYAEKYGLKLHYVDISWDSIQPCIDPVLRAKQAPVHSIEPQIYKAAIQARADGIQRMIIGEGADASFGGLDQLLSRDWDFDAFVDRYTFTDPKAVLQEPVDMRYLFERYRMGEKIDCPGFITTVYLEESAGSYWNAFGAAGLAYAAPYTMLRMRDPLDLDRIRNGESKYLIRQLFASKYPELPIPDKLPMPRPVDRYFADWKGPKREEFRADLDMASFTGNQKWQLWCLEHFLNLYD